MMEMVLDVAGVASSIARRGKCVGGPKSSNQAARTRFQARRYKRHTRVILDGAMLQWIGWWGYCGYLFRHRERHGVGGAHLVPVSFYCTFHLLSPLPFPPSFHLCPQVGWATAGCVCDGRGCSQ